MNITVIGASAGVGLKTVERALERSHTVTTLSRSVPVLPANPHLNVVLGNAISSDDLKKAITGADAVIVAIGTGKSTKPTTLYSDAATALIRAQNGLKINVPFIVLTGFGAGESGQYNSFWMKLLFSLVLKDVYKDKTRMEELITGSQLNWEIVRPGALSDKLLSEVYRVETNYRKGMNIGSISRSDVADFLIKQAENPTYIGHYPALSNK